jgi:predicted phosphoribosyltransferase
MENIEVFKDRQDAGEKRVKALTSYKDKEVLKIMQEYEQLKQCVL